jgi:hypothetical protein
MSRATWRLAIACLAAQAAGASDDADLPPIPAARRAETYAVYSAVLARPSLNHSDTSSKYLIANATGLAQEGWPDACLDLPPAYASAYQEILTDHVRMRDRSFRLERALSIEKPYELLTPAGAASFMDPRRNPAGSALLGRFAGATDLITLGNVYFNGARTVAAVKMFVWCGRLCGQGTWRVLEKVGTGWEDRNWVNCTRLAGVGGAGGFACPAPAAAGLAR